MSDEALRRFVREIVLAKSKTDAKHASDLKQLLDSMYATKMLKIREIEENLLNQKLVLERYQTYFACMLDECLCNSKRCDILELHFAITYIVFASRCLA